MYCEISNPGYVERDETVDHIIIECCKQTEKKYMTCYDLVDQVID